MLTGRRKHNLSSSSIAPDSVFFTKLLQTLCIYVHYANFVLVAAGNTHDELA